MNCVQRHLPDNHVSRDTHDAMIVSMLHRHA